VGGEVGGQDTKDAKYFEGHEDQKKRTFVVFCSFVFLRVSPYYPIFTQIEGGAKSPVPNTSHFGVNVVKWRKVEQRGVSCGLLNGPRVRKLQWQNYA
jgi:hypothetical protein